MTSLALPAGFKHLTLSSGIRTAAKRTPHKNALIFNDDVLSYVQLIERCNRLANALKNDAGVQATDHIGIVAPNCPQFVEVACAVTDLGAAVVTPNPNLTTIELAAILNDASVRLVIVHPDFAEKLDLETLTTTERIICLGPIYEDWLASGSPNFVPSLVPEWAPFSLPYTSGTTGTPKGVVLSHRSRTLSFYANASEYGIYSPDDKFYAIAPMCHGAGLSFAMASLFFGGTCEIAASFDAERTLQTLHKHSITGVFMVPTHFHAIFDLAPSVLEQFRGHQLKALLSNAAPLPQSIKRRIVEYFGEGVLYELYGSTEAGVVSSLPPVDQLRKEQCVGLPFPNTEIDIRDDAGYSLKPGKIGELFSRSPYQFSGYFGRDDETAAAMEDDWVTVGDLARRDEEGYLYIVGRKKEMIISGGVNIYPREIEETLIRHDGVREVAVIGAPDDRWGERLVAYVSFDNGEVADAQVLQEYCRQYLAGYKTPKEFHSISALPRNVAGKVLKHELKALHASSQESLKL